MKQRDEELSKGWVQFVHILPAPTKGGSQNMNCTNTEGAFRIIQSIPSPKAEPFKLWLAKVGYERVQEIENPELAQKRMRQIYKEKGYSDGWIEKRTRGIAVRDELTGEWKKRGVKEKTEYSILTAEISKATFDMNPAETTVEHVVLLWVGPGPDPPIVRRTEAPSDTIIGGRFRGDDRESPQLGERPPNRFRVLIREFSRDGHQ